MTGNGGLDLSTNVFIDKTTNVDTNMITNACIMMIRNLAVHLITNVGIWLSWPRGPDGSTGPRGPGGPRGQWAMDPEGLGPSGPRAQYARAYDYDYWLDFPNVVFCLNFMIPSNFHLPRILVQPGFSRILKMPRC